MTQDLGLSLGMKGFLFFIISFDIFLIHNAANQPRGFLRRLN